MKLGLLLAILVWIFLTAWILAAVMDWMDCGYDASLIFAAGVTVLASWFFSSVTTYI